MAVMIETRNLTYTYPAPEGETNPPALRDVSVQIEKGSFTVVLGHNGSGKSTFAKHLNAVLLPCGGAVYVGTERQRVSSGVRNPRRERQAARRNKRGASEAKRRIAPRQNGAVPPER